MSSWRDFEERPVLDSQRSITGLSEQSPSGGLPDGRQALEAGGRSLQEDTPKPPVQGVTYLQRSPQSPVMHIGPNLEGRD